MNTSRSALALLVAALVLTQMPARAEVAAETDIEGRYVRTVVFSNASVRNLKIWSVQREKIGYYPLNPSGDDNGDLWPLIADQPVGEFKPWVVWSRFNGADFDLAWSTFRKGSWRDVTWVEDAPSSLGDDLDPAIAFDGEGRPHLVWWRNEGGTGRVYLSLFLVSRWMPAFLVSDQTVDSVQPDIEVRPDGTIEISYDTPAGRITRVVKFARPATITDDVTPFGRMTVTHESSSSDSLSN